MRRRPPLTSLPALALLVVAACADDPAPTNLETESSFELGGGDNR